MSSYKVPDSVFKRLSITAPDHGILHNLIRRIIPMIAIIISIITVCIVPAYSLSGRAIPRQFVVGIYITTAILLVLWVTLYSINYCRAKCAGKHNLRLEPPAVEPEPVPKAPTARWDSIGPGYFPERAKQVPAVARRGRESTGFGDFIDKVKDWLDGGHWHHSGNVREREPAHVPRRRVRSGSRYAPHNHHDTWREDAAKNEGMLATRQKRYLDLSNL